MKLGQTLYLGFLFLSFPSRYLRDEISFVSKDKIAIWGWSYGGYASAMALASEPPNNPDSVFSCGMSVAPVTSWLYYGK